MFFNRRKRYNADVGSLLPVFGIDIEEAGVFKLMDIVDIAWARKYSAYEAALLIAYSFASGLNRDGLVERTNAFVKDKLLPAQEDWIKKGHVRLELVALCEKVTQQAAAVHGQS